MSSQDILQELRNTCMRLGIQGHGFSEAIIPDHKLRALIETIRPHIETPAKADAWAEGVIAALVDDGYTPAYATARSQELNPYTEE